MTIQKCEHARIFSDLRRQRQFITHTGSLKEPAKYSFDKRETNNKKTKGVSDARNKKRKWAKNTLRQFFCFLKEVS